MALLGFSASLPRAQVEGRRVLLAMAEATRTNQLQSPVVEREGPSFAVARLRDARAPRRGRSASDGRWHVWLDGDIYEQSGPLEPFTSHGAEPEAPDRGALLLLARCQADSSLRWLRSINGEFRAVIWDGERARLHLVTDRSGLRSFYYCLVEGELYFAPCVRALALNLGSRLRIDLDAAQQLLLHGHLRGVHSLFDGIRLLPEGALLVWDTQKRELELQQHWSYAELEGLRFSGARVDALERTIELLKAAVRRQLSPSERVGVSLSGGLDSRALLATAASLHPRLVTATAYRTGTADEVIAKEITKRMQLPHYTTELTERSWFTRRLDAIWWTDGQLNPLHMTGLTSGLIGCQHFDVNLDGFLGDAILGGGYLSPGHSVGEQLIDRGRRFINEGRRLTEVTYGRNRTPFIDPQLLEFGMSLPPAWRRNGHFYGQALRRSYPALFGPLNHNGRPVPGAPWVVRGFELVRDIIVGRGVTLQRRSGDYERWLRTAPMRTLLYENLHDERLNEWLPSSVLSRGQRMLDAHARGNHGYVEHLGRYLALATYLLQVHDLSYRPEPVSYPWSCSASNG